MTVTAGIVVVIVVVPTIHQTIGKEIICIGSSSCMISIVVLFRKLFVFPLIDAREWPSNTVHSQIDYFFVDGKEYVSRTWKVMIFSVVEL